MRRRKLLLVVGLVVVVVVAVFAGKQVLRTMGVLDPPTSPGATSSYALEDIYNRLASGAAGGQSTFTEPTTGPGTGTMHTLNEIMGVAPAKDDVNGAVPGEVLTGKTYWGLRTDGTWGPQAGTAATGSNVSGPNGSKTFSIPDGTYAGKTATANDSHLLAGNIAQGVNIFGVTGSYAVTSCTGNATTADVLYPKTFSNSSSTGLTGQRYGGCMCTSTGTMYGTRWCDNGDGTVTDLTTCLVWLKKASWGGTKPWREEGDWSHNDDANTRAGLLSAADATAGLSDGSAVGDWRLPTKTELYGLANGPEAVSAGNMRAFTGVQSFNYWSSTTYAGYTDDAWVVNLVNGNVGHDYKNYNSYVWPVRGGQ